MLFKIWLNYWIRFNSLNSLTTWYFHKPIFVVPNPIFSENWIWSNNLVTSWKVNLLSDFSPILELFGIDNWKEEIKSDCQYDNLSVFESLTQEEKNLLKIVSQHHNQDFSQWMGEISSDYWEAMVKLTHLEIQWYVSQTTPGNYFVKVKLN